MTRPPADHVELERAIREKAAENLCVLTLEELLDVGLTPARLRYRVEVGRLVRLHRGVFLVDCPIAPAGSRELAAIRAIGAHVALSGASAAVLMNWPIPERLVTRASTLVELSTGRRLTTKRRGIALRRVARLPLSQVTELGPIPITTPERTMLDLAALLQRAEAARLITELFGRSAIDREKLAALIDGSPRRRGAPMLGEILADGVLLTRSGAERMLLDAIAEAGLPRPETQAKLRGYEVDALWCRERVVVEMDGFGTHGQRRRTFERDRDKAQELSIAGWALFPVSHRQLTRHPDLTMRRLAQLLTARSESPDQTAGMR